MDLDKLIDKVADEIAEGDYPAALETLDTIQDMGLKVLHSSPRLPELNDYAAHVYGKGS